MKKYMIKIKNITKEIIKIAKRPEMKILPGNITFSLVLSLFPLITLVAVLAMMFSVSISALSEFLTSALPVKVGEILVPYVESHFASARGFDINIAIFMITGFVLASNGADSIIVSSNTLYNIKSRSYFKRRFKAIILTLIILLLLIFILSMVAFGNYLIKILLAGSMFSGIQGDIYNMYLILKWPISFLFIFGLIKVIYTVAPSKKVGSEYTTIGAVFTTISWIIVTLIYSYYASEVASYDVIYGSLSNIIIMMIYLYLLSYTLVLGIAINATKYEIDINHKDLN